MISISRLTAAAGSFRLNDVSLTIAQGAYGVVIGPAGAGKTTLIDVIAGLVPAQSGTIALGGQDVTRASPESRRLGVVYQHAYLFPHLSVEENVRYGAVDASVADEMIDRFGVAGLVQRRTTALSGGERQLVALARALARRPEVLLLDEPFAALDSRTRIKIRRALRALYLERRFTVLHVTHDFAEAGMVGDVVVLMDGGRVIQSGPPEDLFRRPANAYIADFLGADNVFAGIAKPIDGTSPGADDAVAAAFDTGALTFFVAGAAVKGATHAVLRAEEVILSAEPASSSIRNQFRGVVTELVRAGAITRVTIDVSGTPLVAAVTSRSAEELRLEPGKEIVAAFKATAIHLC